MTETKKGVLKMTKGLLRGELKKLTRCKPFLVMMALFVGFSLMIGQMMFGNQERAIEIDPVVAQIAGIHLDPVERGESNFWMMVHDSSIVAILPTAFAAVLLGVDFKRRGASQEMMAGYSRGTVFFVKAAEYYLLLLLVLAIYPVYSMVCYCAPWLAALDSAGVAKVIQTLFLRFLIDLGHISLFLPLAFYFRDVLKTAVASVGLMAASSLVPHAQVGEGFTKVQNLIPWAYYQYLLPHPGAQPGDYWYSPPLAAGEITVIVVGSLALTVISILAAYLLFRRAELK